MLWASNHWSTQWGIFPDDTLVWYAIGIVALTAPKFTPDLGHKSPGVSPAVRR